MEKDWRKESFDETDRWYDENGIIRKTVLFKNSVAFYYDENSYWHRLDGPAREWATGKEWYIHGKQIYCSSQEEFERLLKLKVFW